MLAKLVTSASVLVASAAVWTFSVGAQSIPTAKPSIVTFDASWAGTAPGQGTFAFVVSPAGRIMGDYIDANGAYHGFLRSPQGAFTSFDAPGAGGGAGQGTQPNSMNVSGQIAGTYIDANGSAHGFLRSAEGDFVTFDVANAGAGACNPMILCASGTEGASIGPDGTLAGQYSDINGVFHGFVRLKDGTIRSFDAPGAGTGKGEGTFATYTDGINPAGAIAGGYADANGGFHALVRSADGTIVTFDPPGSIFTNNSGITPNGTVTSFYMDVNSVYHGYVRATGGAFTFFDVPGAGKGALQGTEPLNINVGGSITGAYVDSNGVNHGFLRDANGAITKFDVEGAGKGSGQGTIPINNNSANAICGYYVDANGVSHGFLRQ